MNIVVLFLCAALQIHGSKNARIGVLFNADEETNLPSLYFVKVFEITASSYRFVTFFFSTYFLPSFCFVLVKSFSII